MGKKAEFGVLDVARILHKDPQFVRVGLQRGFFNFGCAFKIKEESNRYQYVVYQDKFFQTIGKTREEVS